MKDFQRIIAALPMSEDGTGHLNGCGYTDDGPTPCDCADLGDRLRAALSDIRADIRAATREHVAQEIEAGVLPSHPNKGYIDGHAHAAQIARLGGAA